VRDAQKTRAPRVLSTAKTHENRACHAKVIGLKVHLRKIIVLILAPCAPDFPRRLTENILQFPPLNRNSRLSPEFPLPKFISPLTIVRLNHCNARGQWVLLCAHGNYKYSSSFLRI